jgi:hypothetical protein
MSKRSLIGFIIVVALSAIGAVAGEVRIQGDTIVFDAGIGEVNTVTINARGSVFDRSSGLFISEFTVTDSTTLTSARLPCLVCSPARFCVKACRSAAL